MKRMWTFAVSSALALAALSSGDTLYVKMTGSDSNSGTHPANDAKRTIQAAVDAAAPGDWILVDDGVYDTNSARVGGVDSRVALTNPVTLKSLGGAANCFIVGVADFTTDWEPYGGRCVYMTNGAKVIGFTLQNGRSKYGGSDATQQSGGGAFLDHGGELVDCVVEWGSAFGDGGGVFLNGGGIARNCRVVDNGGWEGGGIACYGGEVRNCIVSKNTAWAGGGGITCKDGAVLVHCTISGNSGIGLDCQGNSSVTNCIVWNNGRSPDYGNWRVSGGGVSLANCCTTPEPPGDGHVVESPDFAPWAEDRYHLRWASPCVDAAITFAGVTDDCEGRARPIDGNRDGTNRSDIGATKYDSYADFDRDGMSDGDEALIGFNPGVDETYVFSVIARDCADYGLYDITTVHQLSQGCRMVPVTGGLIRLQVQLERCTNLLEGAWSNSGPVVERYLPALENKGYYRLHGSP